MSSAESAWCVLKLRFFVRFSTRTGAEGRIDSIYLRDPDGNLVEIGVYPERTEKR